MADEPPLSPPATPHRYNLRRRESLATPSNSVSTRTTRRPRTSASNAEVDTQVVHPSHISQLRKKELVQECNERGLDGNGKKDVLIARIREHAAEQNRGSAPLKKDNGMSIETPLRRSRRLTGTHNPAEVVNTEPSTPVVIRGSRSRRPSDRPATAHRKGIPPPRTPAVRTLPRRAVASKVAASSAGDNALSSNSARDRETSPPPSTARVLVMDTTVTGETPSLTARTRSRGVSSRSASNHRTDEEHSETGSVTRSMMRSQLSRSDEQASSDGKQLRPFSATATNTKTDNAVGERPTYHVSDKVEASNQQLSTDADCLEKSSPSRPRSNARQDDTLFSTDGNNSKRKAENQTRIETLKMDDEVTDASKLPSLAVLPKENSELKKVNTRVLSVAQNPESHGELMPSVESGLKHDAVDMLCKKTSAPSSVKQIISSNDALKNEHLDQDVVKPVIETPNITERKQGPPVSSGVTDMDALVSKTPSKYFNMAVTYETPKAKPAGGMSRLQSIISTASKLRKSSDDRSRNIHSLITPLRDPLKTEAPAADVSSSDVDMADVPEVKEAGTDAITLQAPEAQITNPEAPQAKRPESDVDVLKVEASEDSLSEGDLTQADAPEEIKPDAKFADADFTDADASEVGDLEAIDTNPPESDTLEADVLNKVDSVAKGPESHEIDSIKTGKAKSHGLLVAESNASGLDATQSDVFLTDEIGSNSHDPCTQETFEDEFDNQVSEPDAEARFSPTCRSSDEMEISNKNSTDSAGSKQRKQTEIKQAGDISAAAPELHSKNISLATQEIQNSQPSYERGRQTIDLEITQTEDAGNLLFVANDDNEAIVDSTLDEPTENVGSDNNVSRMDLDSPGEENADGCVAEKGLLQKESQNEGSSDISNDEATRDLESVDPQSDEPQSDRPLSEQPQSDQLESDLHESQTPESLSDGFQANELENDGIESDGLEEAEMHNRIVLSSDEQASGTDMEDGLSPKLSTSVDELDDDEELSVRIEENSNQGSYQNDGTERTPEDEDEFDSEKDTQNRAGDANGIDEVIEVESSEDKHVADKLSGEIDNGGPLIAEGILDRIRDSAVVENGLEQEVESDFSDEDANIYGSLASGEEENTYNAIECAGNENAGKQSIRTEENAVRNITGVKRGREYVADVLDGTISQQSGGFPNVYADNSVRSKRRRMADIVSQLQYKMPTPDDTIEDTVFDGPFTLNTRANNSPAASASGTFEEQRRSKLLERLAKIESATMQTGLFALNMMQKKANTGSETSDETESFFNMGSILEKNRSYVVRARPNKFGFPRASIRPRRLLAKNTWDSSKLANLSSRRATQFSQELIAWKQVKSDSDSIGVWDARAHVRDESPRKRNRFV